MAKIEQFAIKDNKERILYNWPDYDEDKQRENEKWVEFVPIYEDYPITLGKSEGKNLFWTKIYVLREEIPIWPNDITVKDIKLNDDYRDTEEEIENFVYHNYHINWKFKKPNGEVLVEDWGALSSEDWYLESDYGGTEDEPGNEVVVGAGRLQGSPVTLKLEKGGDYTILLGLKFGWWWS